MASSATKFICLFLILSLAGQSMATDYIVGDSLGWCPLVPDVLHLVEWLVGKTFHVGDILHFNYQAGIHSVTQVNLLGYVTCSAAVSLFTDASGVTSFPLTKTGTYYFISNVGVDCLVGGVKVAVNVVA